MIALLLLGGLLVVAKAKKQPPRSLDLTKTKFSVQFPPSLVTAGARPPRIVPTQTEDHHDAEAIGGAIGATAATGGCVALGVSAPLAPLCGIGGKYIGAYVAPYVEDGAKEVGNAVEDAADWLNPF